MEINYNAGYTLKFLTLRTSKVRVFTPLIVKMPSVRLGAKGISAKPRFDYNSCAYTSTNTPQFQIYTSILFCVFDTVNSCISCS